MKVWLSINVRHMVSWLVGSRNEAISKPIFGHNLTGAKVTNTVQVAEGINKPFLQIWTNDYNLQWHQL